MAGACSYWASVDLFVKVYIPNSFVQHACSPFSRHVEYFSSRIAAKLRGLLESVQARAVAQLKLAVLVIAATAGMWVDGGLWALMRLACSAVSSCSCRSRRLTLTCIGCTLTDAQLGHVWLLQPVTVPG